MLRRSFTSFPNPNVKNKNLLDILDDIIIDETKQKDKNYKSKIQSTICKSCDKIIYNKTTFDDHQSQCFIKKIHELTIEIDNLKNTIENQKEDILHELRVKYLELIIENNNNKWNKLVLCQPNFQLYKR
jgi:hypothetical protein